MKKIIYVSTLDGDKLTGVTKKIFQQIDAFRDLGYEVSYFIIKDKNCVFVENNVETLIGKLSENKILYNLQFLNYVLKCIKKIKHIDLLYIRKFFSNPIFIRLIRYAKKKNITVIEELPTYPYDEECENSPSKAIRLTINIDRIFRRFEKNYIYRYVTYSEDEYIFNVKTIPIINGIDIRKTEPIHYRNSNVLNILCIAVMEYWQGYDRLIKSLAEYYKTTNINNQKDIYLHMVGDGSKLAEWKKLSEDLSVQNYVKFYGFKQGKELDKIYDKCQLGCASLGAFRKGIEVGCALKIKEYIAKGLPFIYATEEKYLENFKYCSKIPDDESLFDMNALIEFNETVSKIYDLNEMRSFAFEHYDWKKIMKKVTDSVL